MSKVYCYFPRKSQEGQVHQAERYIRHRDPDSKICVFYPPGFDINTCKVDFAHEVGRYSVELLLQSLHTALEDSGADYVIK